MIKPTLEEAKKHSQGCTVVPIALEILADQKTPIEILRNIRSQSNEWFLLESVNGSDSWGRYTFLGYKPLLSIYGDSDGIHKRNGINESIVGSDALIAVREVLSMYKSPRFPYLPPFTGGFVGYFAYGFASRLASWELPAAQESCECDFRLLLFDKVIAFDHFKQKIFIITNIPTENIDISYVKGVTELKDIEKMILSPANSQEDPSICGNIKKQPTYEGFAEKALKAKKEMENSGILSASLSSCTALDFHGSLLNTYRLLRTINPSPYMAYMKLGGMEIACSSPQTLVSVRNGKASCSAIAGSFPSDSAQQLKINENELLKHDLFVDIALSDIGKISSFGTVEISSYREENISAYASCLSSMIAGELKEGFDALDAIAAVLPAAPYSGVPRLEASRLMCEIEESSRSLLGGCLGYIDFTGNMDMCISTRIASLREDTVYVQAACAFTAESDLSGAWAELNAESKALLEALAQSEEDLWLL
ncbi:MAG: chorismate-binding protein [Eubacteriaceae bacterium]|nr:chorismate-binding protein [Eubacteriaceae bacterium]